MTNQQAALIAAATVWAPQRCLIYDVDAPVERTAIQMLEILDRLDDGEKPVGST